MKRTCEDRKVANMHKRSHHNIKLNPRLGTNAIDVNTVYECNEENFVLNGDFEINDAER